LDAPRYDEMHFTKKKGMDGRYREVWVSLTKEAWEENKEARKKKSQLGFWYKC
jgi:hypothetical protein